MAMEHGDELEVLVARWRDRAVRDGEGSLHVFSVGLQLRRSEGREEAERMASASARGKGAWVFFEAKIGYIAWRPVERKKRAWL
jgi:hypothetical protein